MSTPPFSEDPVVPPTVHRNASWGAIISILVILTMIVAGAFYSWGKRIREEQGLGPAAVIQSLSATTTASKAY